MADPPVPEPLRAFSKDALKRSHRLEVAGAIGRLKRDRIHASMVIASLENGVPMNKVSAELNDYAKWGLLQRVADGSRNAVYEVHETVFFEFAARLEEEIRKRGAP
jgi:hypothetical protein